MVARRRGRHRRRRLRLPSDFASVAANLDDDALSGIVITDQLDDIDGAVRRFANPGVTNLSIHQVGPRQIDFLELAAQLTNGQRTHDAQSLPRYTPQGRSDVPSERALPGPSRTPQGATDRDR